jgi:hypothetical protein
MTQFGLEDRDWCDAADPQCVGSMGFAGSDYCESGEGEESQTVGDTCQYANDGGASTTPHLACFTIP